MTDILNHGTLTTNLISYWELNETSGTRVDSHGSNDLTDNNTVTSVAGLSGQNAARFTRANSEYLSITDAAQTGLDLGAGGTDFTFASFVYFDQMPITSGDAYTLLGKYQNFGVNSTFQLRVFEYANSEAHIDLVSGATVTQKTFNVSGISAWTTGTWYHMGWQYDASAGNCTFWLNGTSSGTVTGLPTSTNDAGDTVTMGVGLLASGEYLDGRMQFAGVWDKLLSSSEMSDLYNSGNGRVYDAGGGATFTPKVTMI